MSSDAVECKRMEGGFGRTSNMYDIQKLSSFKNESVESGRISIAASLKQRKQSNAIIRGT